MKLNEAVTHRLHHELHNAKIVLQNVDNYTCQYEIFRYVKHLEKFASYLNSISQQLYDTHHMAIAH